MPQEIDFNPDHGMNDDQLMTYWLVVHGLKRSRSWLRNARMNGVAPPYWRDGLIAKTDRADADKFVEQLRARKFTSTEEERMRA